MKTQVRPGQQASTMLTIASAPYDYYHDRYQAYYLAGIEAHLDELDPDRIPRRDSARAKVVRRLRTVRHSYRLGPLFGRLPGLGAVVDRLARRIEPARTTPSGHFHPLVGQYTLGRGTASARFCIDAADSGELASPDLLDWADVYFKTNYWPDLGYPARVIPLANGNPLLLGRFDELRALRDEPKSRDVTCVVRVWGGRDEVEGVEHNLRLIEAVNRSPGSKNLLAYLVAGDVPAIARRLDAQGIPWTRRPLRLDDLWKMSARSRTVVLRLGMHHCLPWRMMDSLAMGSRIILDQLPRTSWQHPLVRGEHFESLDLETSPDRPVADAVSYAAVGDRLGAILDDEDTNREGRAAVADLFDRHLMPVALGRFIVARVDAGRGGESA